MMTVIVAPPEFCLTPDQARLLVTIEQTLEDLRNTFPAAQFGEPADAAAIREVYECFPNAPEELKVFWSTCDGVNLSLDDAVVGIIYSVAQLAETLDWWLGDSNGIHSQLLPIADDGCGDFDCVHCGDSALKGCVLFVAQHWTPAYILAGSFSSYLRFWADKCKTVFHPSGKKDSKFVAPSHSEWPWLGKPELQHPWPFDEDWLRSNDADAERILRNADVRGFFESQDNLQ